MLRGISGILELVGLSNATFPSVEGANRDIDGSAFLAALKAAVS